jgi:hypothetical protein
VLLQLVSKVLVQERKRLIAAEQTYMRSEDTMREQVCLAEHNADLGQPVTSQGFATLQVRIAVAAESPCKTYAGGARAHPRVSFSLMSLSTTAMPAVTQHLLLC